MGILNQVALLLGGIFGPSARYSTNREHVRANVNERYQVFCVDSGHNMDRRFRDLVEMWTWVGHCGKNYVQRFGYFYKHPRWFWLRENVSHMLSSQKLKRHCHAVYACMIAV